jgi:hypothetical protein
MRTQELFVKKLLTALNARLSRRLGGPQWNRHCEERSDEAIYAGTLWPYGLLRFARNDEAGCASSGQALSDRTPPTRASRSLERGRIPCQQARMRGILAFGRFGEKPAERPNESVPREFPAPANREFSAEQRGS